MPFIGKEPQTGAYSMLDSLTASATASYSLTLDSVAFVPESANHLLVSLNGSIQKAGSSYTVSGSTLTFSSTLASSDSIDFVLALGNVLDIGTPSDATVTNAKTNFVSTSSSAGLQIKGDGTTDGTLQLNCSQNSHGIKLKSPNHASSSSYTLTFPTTDPSADKFLKTDGSGNLSFADAGGNTPSFHAYRNGDQSISNASVTKIQFNVETYDSDSKYDHSTNYRFTPTVAGQYFIYAGCQFKMSGSKLYQTRLYIYKNGSSYAYNHDTYDDGSQYQAHHTIQKTITFDADDYVECYAYLEGHNTSGQVLEHSDLGIYFGGFKIGGASG